MDEKKTIENKDVSNETDGSVPLQSGVMNYFARLL